MKKEERWTVNRIQEADYGCEERPEGEKTKVIVTLTDAAGRSRELLVEDQWLYENGIDGGSLWPEQGDA
jgi:hypothetical protein